MASEEHNNEQASFHLEGGRPIFDKPPSAEKTARETQEREAHEFARDQVKANSRIAWFTGLLVVATFSTIGIGIWQASISQISASAAKEAATAATSAANTASQTLIHITNNDAATAATNTASFEAQERAYFSLIAVDPTQANPLERGANGFRYCFDAHFVNTGKTPAIGANFIVHLVLGSNAKASVESFREPKYLNASNADTPGIAMRSTACTEYMTEEKVRSVAQYEETVTVYGAIRFKDIFGHMHTNGFCQYRPTGYTSFTACGYGNWYDKKPKG